jgi:hypothetical protein
MGHMMRAVATTDPIMTTITGLVTPMATAIHTMAMTTIHTVTMTVTPSAAAGIVD